VKDDLDGNGRQQLADTMQFAERDRSPSHVRARTATDPKRIATSIDQPFLLLVTVVIRGARRPLRGQAAFLWVYFCKGC